VTNLRVCLVGFGEVGQTLAEDLARAGVTDIVAWDVKLVDPRSLPSLALENSPVRPAADAASAAREAQLVISAVTAAQNESAARAVAPGLSPNAFFLDLNSVSPAVKQAVARSIGATSARYIEGAVMSPIGPKRVASPILLGGPHADDFLPLAQTLGFTGTRVFAPEIGRASAAKMCRSVMIKGIEALLTESLLAARHYGVEETLLASLEDLFPGTDVRKLARYMISRTLIHGVRRAEEMREVARTIADTGLTPYMSAACAERQDWAAQFRPAADAEHLTAMLDAMLAEISADPPLTATANC